MYSEITDELYFKLYLDAGKEWCLTFSPISQSEASISVNIKQDNLVLQFKTLCYGHDLFQFAKSLSAFEAGETQHAQFLNSLEELQIEIESANELGDIITTLKYHHTYHVQYLHIYNLDEPKISKIPVITYAGKISDCISVKTNISEFIRYHKLDTRHYTEINKNG